MLDAELFARRRSSRVRRVADAVRRDACLDAPEARRLVDQLAGKRPTPGGQGEGVLAMNPHTLLLPPPALQFLHNDPEAVWHAIIDIWPGIEDGAVMRAVSVAEDLMEAELATVREFGHV